jgi:magnesium chelatase family protein
LTGTGAEIVTVEARFEPRDTGRTEIVLTGLPDAVLRESKGRLECALEENRLSLASGRLFVNLVPAALKKSGEILDLPIALAAAAACGHFDARVLRGALFLGELSIDGQLSAVPGGLASAIAAQRAGVKRLFAPHATAEEAATIEELEVFAAAHLAQVLAHLCGGAALERLAAPSDLTAPDDDTPSIDDVRGLAMAKHALSVAAAGGHGLLFVGPPGAGKSLLARRLVRLLAPPTRAERIEITQVLSAVGRWPRGLARSRPFRAPHHTITYAGLVGGGSNAAAGEITLAHRGVLFLDELPEFRRDVLEALRQPLETGSISISRVQRQVELPARFQLVAAMNPCPCGYLGHPRRTCRCPPSFVERYRHRISGPLLDRIDLCVDVSPPSIEELAPAATSLTKLEGHAKNGRARASSHSPCETDLIELVRQASGRMIARQGTRRNADLSAEELDRIAPLDDGSRALLLSHATRTGLSARALQSLRRVARTVADLEGVAGVGPAHHAQAIALRRVLV